jgi:hypothetical protein
MYVKAMCEEAKNNEQFAGNHPQAAEALRLSFDLWNYTFDAETSIGPPMTIPIMLVHVVQPQIHSMIYSYFLGNIPACYMSMRIILEGIVDVVIAHARFCDHQFPEDLKHLRVLEQRKNLSFADKCELLLPAQVNEETIKEMEEFWRYLSEYWAHAKGIVRKVVEKTMPTYLPYAYDEDDADKINEYVTKLRELRKVVEELLESIPRQKK